MRDDTYIPRLFYISAIQGNIAGLAPWPNQEITFEL
jgi:hypothetical protein